MLRVTIWRCTLTPIAPNVYEYLVDVCLVIYSRVRAQPDRRWGIQRYIKEKDFDGKSS